MGPTIFAEMSALAARTQAINLGQGFPDSDGPASVSERAVAALRGGENQYPPGLGRPELREAIARHQDRHYGIALDPATQVVVTTGCTEAIAGALFRSWCVGDCALGTPSIVFRHLSPADFCKCLVLSVNLTVNRYDNFEKYNDHGHLVLQETIEWE